MSPEEVSKILRMLETLRLISGNKRSADYYAIAAKNVIKFKEINLNNYTELDAGNKILSVVKSILKSTEKTGVKELDELSNEEYYKISVITELMEIKGIGIKKAEKYYSEGKRTIDDLAKSNSGISKMTRSTINYAEDLKLKVKRETIDKWLDKFEDIIKEINEREGTKLFSSAAGSYSRGSEYSGDLDVILCSDKDGETSQYIEEIIERIKNEGLIVEKIAFKNKKFEGIGFIENEAKFQVDIEIVNSLDEYYYEILYFTGPASLNIKMRAKANELGYHLTNHEMTDIDGNKVIVNSEEEIFQILQMEYIPPQQR